MRLTQFSVGRLAALLASLLVVGTASAADVATPQPVLTMNSPAPYLDSLLFPPAPLAHVEDPHAPLNALPVPDMIAGMGKAIRADALEDYRGGDDTQVDNTVAIDGSVDGNTADRIVSGSNTIDGGAFANATGISTVIQNSGSNVLIQNGMVVNIQFMDPGL